jgi:AcrR family transcriptional regulator
MASRQRTSSSEVRKRILDAALELLTSEGPDSVTVRGIAKQANVAAMGVYNHFEGKNGVIDAIWTQGFDRLREAMEKANVEEEPIVALEKAGANYRRFALDHVAHYQVMFMLRIKDYVPTIEAARSAALAHNALVVMVERAQRSGFLEHQNSYDLAQQFWSVTHGYVSLEILHMNFAANPEKAYLSAVHALGLGLGPNRAKNS